MNYYHMYPYELRKFLEQCWIIEKRTPDELSGIWRNTDTYYRLTKLELIRYIEAHNKGIRLHYETIAERFERFKYERDHRDIEFGKRGRKSGKKVIVQPKNDAKEYMIQVFRIGL